MRGSVLAGLFLCAALPLYAATRVTRDVAYGSNPAQHLDVYAPEHPRNAPMILMVHGGAWRIGDKEGRGVVENKVEHWVSKGFVFVSVNYRLLPEADALAQARDIANALDYAHKHAKDWGADPRNILLMGHSAGAHLVALVAASHKPDFRGAVILDSAALDVVDVMSRRHFGFYDDAFGSDPERWRAASPYHQLAKGQPPFLLVCSTRRAESCRQANAFAQKARSLGIRATVLEEDLSHLAINRELGDRAVYTEDVDRFIRSVMR